MSSLLSRQVVTIGEIWLTSWTRGIPFRLINPFTLKRIRDGKDINRRKTDFRDAEMAAELLRNGEFVETKLPKGIYAELRATYSTYRRLVKERSRAKNLLNF